MLFKRFSVAAVCVLLMMTVTVLLCGALSVFLRGDADNDGVVSIMDATRIQRVIAELDDDTDGGVVTRAHFIGDELNILDATAIQRYLADMGNPYHINELVESGSGPSPVDNQLPIIHR